MFIVWRCDRLKYGMAANINQSEQGRGLECKSDKKRKVFRDTRIRGGGADYSDVC